MDSILNLLRLIHIVKIAQNEGRARVETSFQIT